MVDVTTLPVAGEPPKAMTLAELGKKIRTEHEALTSTIRGIVNRAIAIGEDLIKAKDEVGHGSFLLWVKLNCAMTNKTAERYMKLATKKTALMAELQKRAAEADDKFEMISNLSLAQAERLISGESSGGGSNPSDAYDKAEARLVKQLEGLSADVAEGAVNETILRLQSAIAGMKRTTKAAA
jgi:hypothetical protein